MFSRGVKKECGLPAMADQQMCVRSVEIGLLVTNSSDDVSGDNQGENRKRDGLYSPS
jgi:hypothetical protein